MPWPKENYPSQTQYSVIEFLRKEKIRYVLLILLGVYIVINLFFSMVYYGFSILENNKCIFDYIYFSFITGLTIGYGDLSPSTKLGMGLVVFQGIISTFYYSLIISFLGVKILFPYHTIHFSKNIIYNNNGNFLFRIINSHRALLINPEIRVNINSHCIEDEMSRIISGRKIDDLNWLDNHDITIGFPETIQQSELIYKEWQKALANDDTVSKSRFKIRISISGSYGMQQYTQVISYDKNDIIFGNNFKRIKYTDEDKKIIRNIRFNKLLKTGNYWNDFDKNE
jgi:hypothetical protein